LHDRKIQGKRDGNATGKSKQGKGRSKLDLFEIVSTLTSFRSSSFFRLQIAWALINRSLFSSNEYSFL
jgi:hypothetical protein